MDWEQIAELQVCDLVGWSLQRGMSLVEARDFEECVGPDRERTREGHAGCVPILCDAHAAMWNARGKCWECGV